MSFAPTVYECVDASRVSHTHAQTLTSGKAPISFSHIVKRHIMRIAAYFVVAFRL